MNQFKFRIWDKRNKEFRNDPNEGCFAIMEYGRLAFGGLGIVCDSVYEADYEVQRFSGVCDKNGKEIFEGDIVKISGEDIIFFEQDIFEVKYEAPSFVPLNSYKEVEIIGNIFENPELTIIK